MTIFDNIDEFNFYGSLNSVELSHKDFEVIKYGYFPTVFRTNQWQNLELVRMLPSLLSDRITFGI